MSLISVYLVTNQVAALFGVGHSRLTLCACLVHNTGINVIAATAGNGKVYCKAHSTQLLKARAYEQKAAKQHKARNNGKRSH